MMKQKDFLEKFGEVMVRVRLELGHNGKLVFKSRCKKLVIQSYFPNDFTVKEKAEYPVKDLCPISVMADGEFSPLELT